MRISSALVHTPGSLAALLKDTGPSSLAMNRGASMMARDLTARAILQFSII